MSGTAITLAILAYLCIGFSIGLLIVGVDAASANPKITKPVAVCVTWALLWPDIFIVLLIVGVAAIAVFGIRGGK